jgi:hypothetical protein
MRTLALTLGFLSSVAFAAADPIFWPKTFSGHNESARCATSDDPFDVPAFVYPSHHNLPENVHAIRFPNTSSPVDNGRCVDRTHYRPVLSLSEAGQEAFGLYESNEHIVVANVRHLDKFFVARIPVKKITHMNLMKAIDKMPVLGIRGGHSEMRIFFSEPVQLVQQWPQSEKTAFTVKELIFTGNPTGVQLTDRTDPLKNFDGSLLHARGIHTVDTRLKDSFVDFPTITELQYRLKMNAAEAEAYVRLYASLAETQRLGRPFLLTSLNCNYTHFEVLDAVLKHRYNLGRTPFDPEHVLKSLRERNLVDESVSLLPFQEEEYSKRVISQLKSGKK